MSLFSTKTDAEKEHKAEIKEVKKEARQDRRDARQDAREDKKEARQDAREEKKDVRQEAREEKKEARQEKRDELQDIRQSDLKGEAKHDAKSEARDEKRDAVRDAKDDKRDAIDVAVDAKKDRIDNAKDTKRDTLHDVRLQEIEDLAALSDSATLCKCDFEVDLALELLALTHVAQISDAATLAAESEVINTLSGERSPCLLRAQTVRGAVGIADKDFKSDIECFVARSDAGDVVVAFRGSETRFFDQVGAFKDWVLTDFRANRIPYPPASKSWPDQRWVHAGFWQSYNLIRNELLAEVTRQATMCSAEGKIYVTGFSLGGALALLAALDIADGIRDRDVELVTFAAPRAGDESLNKLLTQRVKKSTLIAFRGDPVVHLPPLGPNFPLTLKKPFSVDLAGIHIGLGNPLPQFGQQYRTADCLIYIDKDGAVNNRFPMAQVALNFSDHDWPPYLAALTGIARARSAA